MKKAKLIAAACLCMCAALALCACSSNVGVITPVEGDQETEAIAAFRGSGITVTPTASAEMSTFAYKWKEPVSSLRVWAELYRDGQLISDPVEVHMNDLHSDSGEISLLTDEILVDEQEFAIFVSNGEGNDARIEVRTGVAELGAAMAAGSTLSIDDTQVVEAGETNVLLVMHDSPDLTTEMGNNLDDTQQLIASSTYTLVLNCSFS